MRRYVAYHNSKREKIQELEEVSKKYFGKEREKPTLGVGFSRIFIYAEAVNQGANFIVNLFSGVVFRK